MITDGSIFVFIHLVNYLVNVFVMDEVSTALNKALELINSDTSILVDVKTVEGFKDVKHRPALKSLPKNFIGAFHLEMCSPH